MGRKKKVEVTVEELIRQYVTQMTGKDDIEVEIIDDIIVLSRKPRWHIYLTGEFTMIGCFVDEDIRISKILRDCAYQIQYIYDHRNEE